MKKFLILKRLKSNKRRHEIIYSFYGMSKYAHARNLFKTLQHTFPK